MTAAHELEPRLVVREDGTHVAVCRACAHEAVVPVVHEPDPHPHAIFVTKAEYNPATGGYDPVEWVRGERAVFDFSAHEEHVRTAHA